MRYQVRQRLLSLAPRFDIANEAGEPILEAVGRAFSLRSEHVIQSLDGREFVRIRRKLFSWRPRFDLFRGGDWLATVARRITLMPVYWVDLASGERLVVSGSFLEHNYRFSLNDETVAVVSQEMWSIRDTYGIDVLEPRFDAVVLATVIAIDAIKSQDDSSS